jgi:hypothetical protein
VGLAFLGGIPMTKRISALDLTAGQVEEIENDFGPIDEWSDAKSKAALLVRILASATGESVAALKAMPMRDLMARASLGAEEANPTTPNEP